MIVNVSQKYDQRSTVCTDFYLSFCHLPESSTGPPIAWIRPRAEADLSDEKAIQGKTFLHIYTALLYMLHLAVVIKVCIKL